MDPKYKICAQILSHSDAKTLIIFQKIGSTENIVQSAEELINSKNLLNAFDLRDIELIRYIVESERDYKD